VSKVVNPTFHRVTREFEKRSEVPVILNTTFNHHGQPIVRSLEDAAVHVVLGCVEYLVIHKYLVDAKVRL
jgi:carbamoyltransferase